MDVRETADQIRIVIIFLMIILPYNLFYLLLYVYSYGFPLPYDIKTYFYSLLSVLMILGSFLPLIIYLIYGKEPQIDYSADYEKDLPTDDPPAIVNAICGSGGSKKIGVPDMDGVKATIMDLIDRNFLVFQDAPADGGKFSTDDSIFLTINSESDFDSLWEFETSILDFLVEYEQEDGIISMDWVSESLSYYDGAVFFRETYETWVNQVKQAMLDGNLKKAFLRKGDRYIKIFGIAGLALAIIIQVFIRIDPLAAVYYMGVTSIILGISSAIAIGMPEKIAGRWTNYGREYYAQWNNFKKYLKDFSLIKQYPPESVSLWNRYMVYATALGVADKVKDAMELSLPKSILSESDIYTFQYYGTPTVLLQNAIKSALEPD
jgi:uncharacterized membrane protein